MRSMKWMGVLYAGVILSGLSGSSAAVWAAYSSPGEALAPSIAVADSESRLLWAATGPSMVPASEPAVQEKPKKKKKPQNLIMTQAQSPKPAQKPAPAEDKGFISGTIDKIFGEDDKAAKPEKAKGGKEEPEEGLLTKTLKSIVGGEEDKNKSKKKDVNPLDVIPTVSATKKKEADQPKTAKTETKKKLKDSFEQLISAGDAGDAGQEATTAEARGSANPSAKKDDSGGILGNLLGGEKDNGKTDAEPVKTVKAGKTKPAEQIKARKLPSRKLPETKGLGNEEKQLEQERGVASKKGKNVLKESFKTLLDKEKEEGN